MSKADEIFIEMCKDILNNGTNTSINDLKINNKTYKRK